MRDFFRLLTAWTSPVRICEDGQERVARAFIQPVSVTQPEYMGRPSPAGTVDERRYLLIAEPDAIENGGSGITVELGGRVYRLLRCEKLGGGSHWEGIMCLKEGGSDA